MKIFVDLDGVIANFGKGICQAANVPYPKQTQFSSYGWVETLMPKAVMYSSMRGHDFWANLEKFPWADKLIKMVNDVSCGNWMFLTKPTPDAGCYSGKYEWIATHFPKYQNKLIICPGTKSVCCTGANDILIDDCPKNITEWVAKGGYGIRWVEKTDDFTDEFYSTKVDFVQLFLKDRVDPVNI